MKKILLLCLVLTVLLSCVGCGKTETTNNDSANTTESTTETTTESTTESTTETTTETTTEKKTETTTNKKVENTTKKPETTTKKQETTTKKPVTTTKPSKSEEEENREMMYGKYGGKEGYKAHLEEIRNYKCDTCGKHNCPSLEYGTDLLGNPGWPSISPEKCPAIINETAKCPHCGKTLVEDNRWQTEPDKYCRGTCHINFG